MVTLWQPLKNKNLLKPNQPKLWKTTLKYKNLFSLTSKILGFYMWVSTVVAMKQNRRKYESQSLIQSVYLLCEMISSF